MFHNYRASAMNLVFKAKIMGGGGEMCNSMPKPPRETRSHLQSISFFFWKLEMIIFEKNFPPKWER